jgi:ribose-phosphate pyrophosphokinase
MLKINGKIFGNEEFRNGEAIYIKPELSEDLNTITMSFQDNRDIANLVMANIYLDTVVPGCEKRLIMPYIPYSRMDRDTNDQIFSLKYFAQLINSMNFSKVIVGDPHSKVSLELIKNLEEVNIEDTIREKVVKELNLQAIMFPDKGARSKYVEKYATLCSEFDVVYGEKKRDLANRGKIVGYDIFTKGIDLTGKNVLIVDDLSSFGNTFKFASKALKDCGAENVYLFVTHAEDTILKGDLLEVDSLQKVFTTNSIIRSNTHPNLIVFDIF